MLVRCPQCREAIRLSDFDPRARVVHYLCQNCQGIVAIDLLLDEIKTSATASSFDKARRSRTILVADDMWGSGEVVAGILREAGYDVRVVHDGDSALEKIRRIHPDLVVLDLMLPGMSSFDVLRCVQEDSRLRGTAIVVVGSVCKPDLVHYLRELGAAGFLDRDRLVETLIFRVRSLLDDPGCPGRERSPDGGGARSPA